MYVCTNMCCVKVSHTEFVKELQGVYKLNEKLIIN